MSASFAGYGAKIDDTLPLSFSYRALTQAGLVLVALGQLVLTVIGSAYCECVLALETALLNPAFLRIS